MKLNVSPTLNVTVMICIYQTITVEDDLSAKAILGRIDIEHAQIKTKW